MKLKSDQLNPIRIRALIQGAVQGVGFRPFIYRLAEEMGLCGFVQNSGEGVILEVEGEKNLVEKLLERIVSEAPPLAKITHWEQKILPLVGYHHFEIQESVTGGETSTLVLPDIATCSQCLKELSDPQDRRWRYPFINCTYCGPRYTIILALPYDRPATTMKDFKMCDQCAEEYHDPTNRRFHAQPIACPRCGPQVFLTDKVGKKIQQGDDAIRIVVEALHNGAIVAVKGIGGFHLLVDASSASAVRRLREKKRREAKPLALMVPDILWAQKLCLINPIEQLVLSSPQAPIVLMLKKPDCEEFVTEEVAPKNPYLGVMLPYSPLHHLILQDFGKPIVATSGNLTDEPIAIDNTEAIHRLRDIVDLFLLHNRTIVHYIDDSVVRVIQGRVQVLRRARGYAPLPIATEMLFPNILALGGHLKTTIALARGSSIFISPHIGDLETPQAVEGYYQTLNDFPQFWDFHPEVIARDLHPDYLTTQIAENWGNPRIPLIGLRLDTNRKNNTLNQAKHQLVSIQHHWAHALSGMIDNGLIPPFLSITWDGTGYGIDGSVWGGECLLIEEWGFQRVGRLKPFPLPGGDSAVRKPYRTAIALLFSLLPDQEKDSLYSLPPFREIGKDELHLLLTELKHQRHSPPTSSVGRLFDAVSSILGICHRSRYEGEAAIALEYEATRFALQKGEYISSHSHDNLLKVEILLDRPFTKLPPLEFLRKQFSTGENETITSQGEWDPTNLIREIVNRKGSDEAIPELAWAYHWALAEGIVMAAKVFNQKTVLLTGGCFQNRLLTEMALKLLADENIQGFIHQQIPPGDGGISVGQVVGAKILTQNNRLKP